MSLSDQCCRGLESGIPENALHLDEDPIVPEIELLRHPYDVSLGAERLEIIGYRRFTALDEGSRDAASAASKHDDPDMPLPARSVKLFSGLFRQFQHKLAHMIPPHAF